MHWESYHRLAQVWRSLRQGGKQLDPTTQADYGEIIAMDTTLTQTLRDLEFTVQKVSAWTGLAVSSFHHRFHPGRRRVTNPTPHTQRRSDIVLNHQERHAIADQLN